MLRPRSPTCRRSCPRASDQRARRATSSSARTQLQASTRWAWRTCSGESWRRWCAGRRSKTLIGRARNVVIPLLTLVTTMLPCLGRVMSGQPFWGGDWQTTLQIVFFLPPMLFYAVPCSGFVFVGVRDMDGRRLIIIKSVTALLSTRSCDRKMQPSLPPEVRALGVLDLKDPAPLALPGAAGDLRALTMRPHTICSEYIL
ncbi:unnamed protein product [Prorocentrum cordatum]|uniref:Transmembrane 9 superfamily member n=1 Tax=Prorocentrum cordatum TaxID=2364126 RepID=A0ABN9TMM3_9DINO|nr:unnamed protein product [Polarella glacialis]